MVPTALFTAGAIYSVRVAVRTTNTWSPLSDVCQITSPGGVAKITAAEGMPLFDLKVVASPNPFATDFGINITTTSQDNVSVKIYDQLGRMVTSTEVKIYNLDALKLGAKYPAGVYNVIVNQSGIVKTLRVIKR